MKIAPVVQQGALEKKDVIVYARATLISAKFETNIVANIVLSRWQQSHYSRT
jgi:hypothetical protein